MSTKYIASNWRLPNEENSNKSDNYGLSFDGSSELINCGTGEIVTGEFTVSMWIKRSLTGGDSTQTFFSKADVNGSRTFACYINKSAGYLQFYVSNTGSILNNKRIATSDTITDENWHHLVFINGGDSGLLKIYIDGSEATLTSSGRTGISNLYSSSIPNIIGDSNVGSNDFSGSISELAIFDYSLSESQISTLYGSSSLGAGNPMALKAPVAYYPLGDNSSGNPLTQPNEAVEDASVFDFVSSSSQYIDCGDNDDFSFGNGTTDEAFSVSAWIKMDTITNFVVLSKYGATASLREYAIGFSPDKIYILLYDDNGAFRGRYYNTSTTSNDWMHIATTYNGVGGTNAQDGIKIYINGTRVDDSTYSSGSYTAMSNTTSELRIGSFSTTYADGKITNAQIWQAELSSTEVTTLYNSGVPLLTGTQPQASNLKAWYKLDQSANWEAESTGAWQIPDANSAYPQSFDFVDDNIKVDNIGSLFSGITNFSFSGWFNLTSFSGQQVFNILEGNSSKFGINTFNNQLRFNVYPGVAYIANLQNITSTNTWFHYAGVFDGSGASDTDRLKLYINGQPQTVTYNTTTPTSFLTLLSTAHIFIGGSVSPFNGMTGKASNIQFWTSSLIPSQIETLYNNGVPLTTAIASDNLKAWYKLDNTATFSTNWSVPDASGNGNTGTSSGMTEQNLVNNNVSALNGESSGMTSANLVLTDLTRNLPYDSYSFNFDGVNDYIDFGTSLGNTLGNYSQSLTFSLWAKPVNTTTEVGLLSIKTVGSNDTATSISMFSNILRLTYGAGANKVQVSTTTAGISANNWFHVVGIYTPNEDGKIYVNGNLQTVTSGGTSPSSIDFTGLGLYVGTYYNLTFNFNGPISNVSIFNKELTSTEVMKLYSNGMPQDLSTFTPAPIAWWTLGSNSFFNGSNFICKDLIGSNDGTSANAGVNALQGNTPRSEANGTGTNMDIPTNLEGTTKYSSNNSWSINMSESARVADTP